MKIKKNSSEKYWARRAAQRMVEYQDAAEQTAADIGKAYAAANSSMQADMHKIFNTFERSFKISESQAKQIFSAIGNDSAMKELRKAALKLPDPVQRQLALDTLQSAPAYSWRVARLDDMFDKIAENCNNLYKADVKKTTDFLGKITKTAYNRATYDLQVGTGTLGAAFDALPDNRIKQILRTNWSGNAYSKRIYANVEDMQAKLKQTLLESMMTGESEREIAAKVAERWQIGYNDARRLIRTETTYVSNQAELESYKNAGIEQYKYVSVLDSRTSEVCQDLNGKKFLINEAVPGKNYPPMHPWCRSTTVAVLPDNWDEEDETDDMLDEWLDADTELSYKEWVEQLQKGEDGKMRYVPTKTETKKAEPQIVQKPAKPLDLEQPKIKPEAKAVEITFEEPTIQTINTPTVKTTEKIYTEERAKEVDISGESGIMKMGKVSRSNAQNPPDFSKYHVVDDPNGISELKSFISAELHVLEKDIDISKLRNVEVAKPFMERLKKIQTECGLNMPRIVATDIIDGDECCIAGFKPFENTFYISSRYFNSKDALLDTLRDWAKKGFIPEQCTSITYVAEHEAAHIRLPNDVIISEKAKRIFKKRKLLNDNDAKINEYYADAVAIFRTNKSLDANIIKAIEYLRERGVKI